MLGYLSIANLLLQAGATVDAVNNGGRTALHYAADNGKIQVVEALLNAGADKAVKGNDGMTALDEAQEEGHPAIVKLLGGDAEAVAAAAAAAEQKKVDKELLTAAENGDEEGVHDLLARGANPNGAKTVR